MENALITPSKAKTTGVLFVIIISIIAALFALKFSIYFAVAISVIGLFALLVKDLRIIVPVVLVAGPLGPKFPMSFGNLYLTTAILIVAYIAWIWRGSLLRSSFTLVRASTAKALILLFMIMFLSILQGLPYLMENPSSILRLVQFFIYTFLFIIVLQLEFTKRQIKAAIVIVLAVGLIETFIGIWQLVTAPGFFMMSGTFDYRHAHLGAHETFVAFIALGALLETRKFSLGVILSICLALYLYTIVFSYARTAYVAFPVGLAAMFLMPFRRGRKCALLLASIAVAVLTIEIVPREVIQRAMSIVYNVSMERIGASYGTRLRLWKTGFYEFTTQPLLGLGPWGYGLADSFYVKILAESGILGLLAYIYVLVAILYDQWLIAKSGISDSFVRGVAYAMLPATVACLIIYSIAVEIFAMHRFMSTYWIIFALLIKWVENERSSQLKAA